MLTEKRKCASVVQSCHVMPILVLFRFSTSLVFVWCLIVSALSYVVGVPPTPIVFDETNRNDAVRDTMYVSTMLEGPPHSGQRAAAGSMQRFLVHRVERSPLRQQWL